MADFYDREKLYIEVWKSPMTEVCKKYGVSDVALAKTCKKLQIPRPPLGYWAKRAVGKAPQRPKLYKMYNAPRISIRKIQEEEVHLVPEAFEEADLLIRSVNEVPCSKDLENLHPYIRNTRKIFKQQMKKQFGNDWNRTSFAGKDGFDISIGLESLDRASLILQSLCSATLLQGFQIVLDEKSGACFQIMNENIAIKISESSKKVLVPENEQNPDKYYPGGSEYIPTGMLRLEINTDSFSMEERKSWIDGKTKKNEDKLVDIMHRIIRAAAWKKEYTALKKKREEKWQIEKMRQVEKDRINRIDKQRVSNLTDGFKIWLYHKDMTEYVAAVQAHYIVNNEEPVGDFAQWVEWAEKYLEKINPLNGEYPRFDLSRLNK
ncbi:MULTISPECIES: hypothetical protein [unclassified Oceanispirochaeta]|uniref:hypothetical protein n=1 Tax=unclassified Oceanispirochaeta TaxID=2635722 RepID=UPI000E09C358|nr:MULTISPECIES: hypothetical protein [unclassified Oceanispirochaeta]MBF9018634.1 hypothetical protein [Oceanispirochaeta sp. M2]NPD75071.1 hypothetical protein [Oceanispirochaeta sp. M1]RDG29097.1 hypothetical protein DV872_23525 [Oceanispirochaeta sp. M1]